MDSKKYDTGLVNAHEEHIREHYEEEELFYDASENTISEE